MSELEEEKGSSISQSGSASKSAPSGSEVSAREALFYLRLAADQLENLAFSIPSPNSWTPQFVMLANSIRHEWALLSERALKAAPASPAPQSIQATDDRMREALVWIVNARPGWRSAAERALGALEVRK